MVKVQHFFMTKVRRDSMGLFGMGRGDSMILTFHVPPPERGQGLCDFDSLWS